MTNDKTRFEVGQEVIIGRNLGFRTNRSSIEYYHGGSIKNVPLGTKATIDRIVDKDQIHLKFKNNRYGIDDGWYVHPGELGTNAEQEMAEREEERRIGSFLESSLIGDEPKTTEEKQNGKGEFNPKFNVREEFAIWVREQFPELNEYAGRKEKYDALIERKDEVLDGARQAYKHAMETTRACTKNVFDTWFKKLESNSGNFGSNLEEFVEYIEVVASNLGVGR